MWALSLPVLFHPQAPTKWWRGQDSNLRSPSERRFYRPFRLATPAPLPSRLHGPRMAGAREGIRTHQPTDYKSVALPLRHSGFSRAGRRDRHSIGGRCRTVNAHPEPTEPKNRGGVRWETALPPEAGACPMPLLQLKRLGPITTAPAPATTAAHPAQCGRPHRHCAGARRSADRTGRQ